MSKSVGNVVDPFTITEHYGVDQVRYFFMREVSFGQDGAYSHEAIVNRINADLANDLGNLAQRSLSMIGRYAEASVPSPAPFSAEDTALLAAADGAARALPRGDGPAGDPPGADGDLAGGGRRQPLFRSAGALGAQEERSGAHGDRALRHGRGGAADRDPGAAGDAGLGGAAARPRRGAGGRAELREPR